MVFLYGDTQGVKQYKGRTALNLPITFFSSILSYRAR